jgi:putative ABC transport system substrate-binding protein
MPKRLALLKQAVPGLTRVAVMYRIEDPQADRVLKSLAEPARSLGLTIIPAGVRNAGGLEPAFEQIAKQKADGILSVADGLFFKHATRVVDLATKHGLAYGAPAIEYARAGALFSYSPDYAVVYRRTATLVDKILKGANPANIPVEQANVYELVVNLKTARQLGITLPRSFLLQATQTIE